MNILMLLKAFLAKGAEVRLVDGKLKLESPPNALDAVQLTQLKEQKEIIVQLFGELKINSSKDYEYLSFAQQRLWLLDQIDGSSAHYNMPGALRLSGQLDIAALSRAFDTILERHESLRTCFAVDPEGQPIQVIRPVSGFTLAQQDLSVLDEGERQLQLSRAMVEETRRPFDLGADLMLRAQLLVLGKGEHILLVTMHHIASDGWSMSILINEFSALYRAYSQGEANPLAALPIQYADYAHWQRDWLQGEVLEQQLGYWAQQLAGLPVVHSLPLDHPRPPVQSFAGETYRSVISRDTQEALVRFCQSRGATLFMGLHAAFSVLLSRYSNETDIVMGSPIANREQSEVAGLIGFFVNTLVLRSDLSGEPGFGGLLEQSKHMLLDAYAHQQVPFEQIVERLQPERSLSHSALFQVMLVLQNNEEAQLALPGLVLEQVTQSSTIAKYDLTLTASETPGGLLLGWEYNTDLFEAATIARMAGHFGRLLESLLAAPEENVFKAGLLDVAERQQLLESWNDTATAYPASECIHELFEARAAEQPDAVALVFEGRQLTYGELNQRSNQLAHYLVNEKQVKADTLVGICVERSFEMVVGILAILKAGGAYVPLDPDYPEARLAYMLEDASLATVLTQQHLRETTPVSDAQALCLDSPAVQEQLLLQPDTNPDGSARGLGPHNLAYVIYTSGSTGNPKGVMVEHRNVVNFLSTMCEQPGIKAGDCLLAVTSTSFDIHGLELFLPLMAGATLVVAAKMATGNPELLMALMAQHQITVMQATPATWKMLLEAGWQQSSPLRVLCGGEALGLQLARMLVAQPMVELWNMYGPTETTIWSTTRRILPGDERILLGQPIGNTQVYIVAGDLQLCPMGVPGELLIAGEGVARGYYKRTELSAEKFIPNPFWDAHNPASSERLYKTGDLVRWLPDGDLEYLGRIDHQVKIRGFRIELGEIENVLRSHSAVKDAVVLVRESNGDKRLVAYLVPDVAPEEVKPDLSSTWMESLRHHLGDTLPDYMVPSAFVILEQLPLTPNGKVDRKALPEPDLSAQQAAYVAPRTVTERVLCEIWQTLLGVERVGISDNFFQLGGHSLLATRLMARINQAFQVNLPLKTLFNSHTLERLANEIAGLDIDLQRPALARVARDQSIPPSFAQQRLWLLDQIDGSSAHYNMPGALRLSGQLDIAALSRAFDTILERHESLRTCFAVDPEGQPIQVIRPVSGFTLAQQDLSVLDEGERQLQLSRAMVEETRRPFDLGADLMLRAQLLVLGKGEHILLVTMHHIASDGWSMSILINEFSALYRAYSQGEANPLAALPIQYADYAHWQRDWLQGEVLEQQLGYWAQQLAGLPVVHSLPLDHPRPPVQSFAGETYRSVISRDTQEALVRFCQSRGATLFMGLHAAFSVLLSRYSNETDIVMGSPIANREQSEVAGLIGFFVNTLVLRSDLSGEPGFGGLLEQSKHMLLDAYAHQQVPFEQIVERLQPERSLSHSALFQVMLVLQNNEEAQLALPGLVLEQVTQSSTIAKYDLTLTASETPGGLLLGWEYNTDLFEAATIARMAGHFGRLLESLLAAPEENVFKAGLLDVAERQQLLESWNDTATAYPASECIHELFEARAAEQPDAVALVFEGRQLTYGELNQRSNQLAHYLVNEKQVKADTLVGICVERSFEMVVGILAILKAGGAYVPLDPDYPEARLAYMLEDASLATVLTQQHLRETTPVSDAQALCLDSPAVQEQLLLQPDTNPDGSTQGLGPHNLAYVIYTSGSTGNPKGVMVEHRNVVNFLSTMCEQPGIKAGDCLLAVTSTSFDIHGLELFLPLMAGATLVVAAKMATGNPELLMALMAQHQITVMQATPATWKMLLEAGWQQSSPLRVLCGGEALGLQLARMLVAQPMVELWNMYGPTETTIWSTTRRILPGDERILLGQPIGNTQVYIVAGDLQLCPMGVPGELLIAGEGVARGYYKRTELSAEKFIPNPFWDAHNPASSERLYKTGDLVRWLPDGDLEYLGRIDHQVKIRGFRIELGEIENVLRSHSVVKDAVVLVRESNGDKRLVAYLVPDVAPEEVKPDLSSTWMESLRHHLGDTLPDYMVPSAFVILEQLPLTPNGKVDRKALPEPDLSAQQAAYVAPRTVTERVLCEIWQTLLGVERVGISDNFFQLGGHSLLATRLMARINQAFQVNLPLKTLFNSHTLERLANEIAGLDIDLQRPALAKVARDQSIPPSFAQQRLWLLDQIDGSSAHYNMPGALRLSGQLDIAALSRAFDTILERHESLRTCFAVDPEGQPIQVIRPVSGFTLAQQDLSVLDEGERQLQLSRAMVEETRRPFDLGADLMLRAQLLVLGKGEHILLVTMHHIASDGWSMSILINEFSALYRAYSQGEANPLAALPIQYADYAHWQRDWLQGEVLEQQLGYWAQQLAGLPVVHSLPLDHPRPPVQSFAGETYRSVISRDTQEALVRFCQSRGATLFMGLHAAFSVLLSRYSNETDIVMGSPIANREQSEVAGLIGFFVNTLVLRSDLSGEPGFGGLLEQSKHMLLDAYAHQQVPFEQIVERLQPERSLSHSALFQVMLVLQNNEEAQLALPGLVLEQVTQSSTIAKYDLTLTASETPGGLLLGWEYNTDLFEAATIARMAGHFGRLLESLLAAPEENVFKAGLLDVAERQQLLESWNDTATAYPASECIHELFEARAAEQPEAVALVFEGRQLTYGELNQRSNQLAHYLVNEKQVKADTLVGICVERSFEMVVSILAILKAGGAYVPLDPVLPEGRLADILAAVGDGVLLTEHALAYKFDAITCQKVLLDSSSFTDLLQNYSCSSPTPGRCHSDSLAYVLFTSGSTGKPKAITMPHGPLVNLIDAIILQAPLLKEWHKSVQFSSIGFDMSFTDIFLALGQGGCLVLIDTHTQTDVVKFAGLVAKENITLLNLPYAMLQMLSEYCVDAGLRLPTLRGIISTAEQLKITPAIRTFFTTHAHCQLINHYGPSETHVVTALTLNAPSSLWPEYPSIGQPISNVQCHLLNAQMQHVPIGVAGHLYLAGRCLARGYLNQQVLTEERFVPNPFAAESGALMYQTGDLVSWNTAGELIYLGRIDQQVKIRGYRIELGEIESALRKIVSVNDAVVLTKEFANTGEKRLVAYLIADSNLSEKDGKSMAMFIEHLRECLGKILPDYMVPAAFVVLEEFPLTPNGKVNRKALPEPDISVQQSVYVAPRTATEKMLCEVWQDILGVDAVGIADNFFQLGGHSLLAMKMLSKVNSLSDVTLSMKIVFSNATVLGMANTIDAFRQYNNDTDNAIGKDFVDEGFF